jgi:hypothetical protein
MLAGPDHPDVIAPVSRRGDRVEGPPVEARLDVEREDPQRGLEAGRLEARIPVDATNAGPPLELPVYGERAANAVVDQVAVREANISFEALHARLGQPSPERWNIARQIDLDAQDEFAGEREQRGLGHAGHGSDTAKRVPVRGPDEEVRREAVVDHDRGLAVLQHGVEVHLRPPVGDAVGRGEQERARQARTSRPLSAGRAPASARRGPAPEDRPRQRARRGREPGPPPVGSG